MTRGLPRIVEAAAASAALAAAAPLIACAALAVKLTSPGPAFFRQPRVGRHGRAFSFVKLRTMRVDTAPGPQVTSSGDARITAVGRVLRKTKLDELPELWNVVAGDMGLVGPRPEVPRYVDTTDPLWHRVLEARPGLTDPVTLRLRNEEELLASVDGDREEFYRRRLLRWKLRGYARYLDERTWKTDLMVLAQTALAVALPASVNPPTLGEITSSS